jgi:hypothetical protein
MGKRLPNRGHHILGAKTSFRPSRNVFVSPAPEAAIILGACVVARAFNRAMLLVFVSRPRRVGYSARRNIVTISAYARTRSMMAMCLPLNDSLSWPISPT